MAEILAAESVLEYDEEYYIHIYTCASSDGRGLSGSCVWVKVGSDFYIVDDFYTTKRVP